MPIHKKTRRDTTKSPALHQEVSYCTDKIGDDVWQVALANLTIRDLCNYVAASKTSRQRGQVAISRLCVVNLEHTEEAEIVAKNCKNITRLIIDECFFQPLNQDRIIQIFENNPNLVVSAKRLTKSTFSVLRDKHVPLQELSQESVFGMQTDVIHNLIKLNKINLLHLHCENYLTAVPCTQLETLSTHKGINNSGLLELCLKFPKLRSLTLRMYPNDTGERGLNVQTMNYLEEITYNYSEQYDFGYFGIPRNIKAIRVLNPVRLRTLPHQISHFKKLVYLDIRINNYYHAICILRGCESLMEFHVGQMESRMSALVGRVVTKSLVVWKIEDDWILEALRNVDFVVEIAPNLKCLRVKGQYLIGDVLSVWTPISPWFKIF